MKAVWGGPDDECHGPFAYGGGNTLVGTRRVLGGIKGGA